MTEHHSTTALDAHFPPDTDPVPGDEVVWNPITNAWEPIAEQHSTWGVAEPGHGDVPVATPMSDTAGHVDEGGTTPDGRMNLWDSVRGGVANAPVVQRIEHVVTTVDKSADLVRGRTVRVTGNTSPTPLLDQNPRRRRALIKVITTASIIVIQPTDQGGNPANNATPSGNSAQYPIATGDPIHEIKSGAAVEAYGTAQAGAVDVAVWEELDGTNNVPGLI